MITKKHADLINAVIKNRFVALKADGIIMKIEFLALHDK